MVLNICILFISDSWWLWENRFWVWLGLFLSLRSCWMEEKNCYKKSSCSLKVLVELLFAKTWWCFPRSDLYNLETGLDKWKEKGLSVGFASDSANGHFFKSRANRKVPSPTLQIMIFKLSSKGCPYLKTPGKQTADWFCTFGQVTMPYPNLERISWFIKLQGGFIIAFLCEKKHKKTKNEDCRLWNLGDYKSIRVFPTSIKINFIK